MSIDDHMAPEASPGELSKKSGVRRVNNRPVFIVLGGLTVFLVIMVLVASDRAANQNRGHVAPQQTKPSSAEVFANEIAGEQKDGIIQAKLSAPASAPAVPAPDSIAIARPVDLDTPPAPPGVLNPPQYSSPPGKSGPDDEAEHIRVMKLQQLDEAVKAKTSVPIQVARSVGGGPAVPGTLHGSARDETVAQLANVRQQIEGTHRDDPEALYKAKLQQMRAMETTPDSRQAGGIAERRSANDIGQFAGRTEGDRWRIGAEPEAPRSRYELRAGFVVPATLISGINSELPGQIVAQVSQDVYDTPLGRYKLIPQGARLVGAYASEIAYGQSRILVAWQRIIFPDGKAMDIGAMPGGDGAGYSGFRDQINNHYLRLFSSAFLMSAVTAGISISQPEKDDARSRPSTSGAISEALGQQLGQVTAQLIAKNLNIAPTLQIRPGYRFNVIVTKDMTFSKPYAAFDY